jgi:hypothetical protein
MTTLIADDLLIDDVSLRSFPGIHVASWEGLLAPCTRRGNPEVIPGNDGAILGNLPYDAYTFDIPISIYCEDINRVEPMGAQARRSKLLANYRSLIFAVSGVGTYGKVVLKRRLSTYDEEWCNGQFLGELSLKNINLFNGRAVLSYRNLDGKWWISAYPAKTSATIP